MTKDKFEKTHEQIDPQVQDRQPGFENEMAPEPIYDDENYKGSGKLEGSRSFNRSLWKWSRPLAIAPAATSEIKYSQRC